MTTALSNTELVPTPEMQASARSGLRRISQSDLNVPKNMIDRAKRIARGVALEDHHVVAMDREHSRALAGLDASDEQGSIEHQLRGGAAGAEWATEKSAYIASQEALNAIADGAHFAEASTTGAELKGMSLLDAAKARRRAIMLSASDSNGGVADQGKRDATFSAARDLHEAARRVHQLQPDDNGALVMTKLSTASQAVHTAAASLPSGHPLASDLQNAITVVDSVRSYESSHGIGKMLDNLGDRLLTLDPDFDGDNDLGGESDGDVELDDSKVKCHSCGKMTRVPESGNCTHCGAALANADSGSGDFTSPMLAGENDEPDLELTWSDQARLAADAARRSRSRKNMKTGKDRPEPVGDMNSAIAAIAHLGSASRSLHSDHPAQHFIKRAHDTVTATGSSPMAGRRKAEEEDPRHYVRHGDGRNAKSVAAGEDEATDLQLAWSEEARKAALEARRAHPHHKQSYGGEPERTIGHLNAAAQNFFAGPAFVEARTSAKVNAREPSVGAAVEHLYHAKDFMGPDIVGHRHEAHEHMMKAMSAAKNEEADSFLHHVNEARHHIGAAAVAETGQQGMDMVRAHNATVDKLSEAIIPEGDYRDWPKPEHSPEEIEKAKNDIKRHVMSRFGGDLMGPALASVHVTDDHARRYLKGASIDDLLHD